MKKTTVAKKQTKTEPRYGTDYDRFAMNGGGVKPVIKQKKKGNK